MRPLSGKGRSSDGWGTKLFAPGVMPLTAKMPGYLLKELRLRGLRCRPVRSSGLEFLMVV